MSLKKWDKNILIFFSQSVNPPPPRATFRSFLSRFAEVVIKAKNAHFGNFSECVFLALENDLFGGKWQNKFFNGPRRGVADLGIIPTQKIPVLSGGRGGFPIKSLNRSQCLSLFLCLCPLQLKNLQEGEQHLLVSLPTCCRATQLRPAVEGWGDLLHKMFTAGDFFNYSLRFLMTNMKINFGGVLLWLLCLFWWLCSPR